MNSKEMGMRIKQCRKMQNITQEVLAEKIDISAHYMYEVERGIKSVSVPILADLAETMNTSTDYLIFGEQGTYNLEIRKDELYEVTKSLSPAVRDDIARILQIILPYLIKKGI